MIETPEYDRMVAEYGDPDPVLNELVDALDATPPEIDVAHGVVDAGELGPVHDPGPSEQFATELSTPDTTEPDDEPDETPDPDTDTGDVADA